MFTRSDFYFILASNVFVLLPTTDDQIVHLSFDQGGLYYLIISFLYLVFKIHYEHHWTTSSDIADKMMMASIHYMVLI